MTSYRHRFAVCVATIWMAAGPANAWAQPPQPGTPTTTAPRPSGRATQPPVDIEKPTPPDIVRTGPPIERVDLEERWRYRPVLRIWQDYALRAGETVRHVNVIFGDATIDGRVDGDVVVVFGNVRLGSTAVVRGAVVNVAGNATVINGASVRDEFVVVGGVVDAPATFSPGGEHVAIGSRWMNERMREVVPWVTRGLLWGRLIVPDIGWVWAAVAFFLIISLVINLLLHEPVGVCADTLGAKPFSTFLVGLLVMLLAGPVSILLAASIVGIVVIPFLWCGLVVAWMVGKVGVTRWLGRGLTGQGSGETRLQGLIAFLVGFVGIYLLYWVPVLGILTWALVGVFGLGSATLSFMTALRKERPAPPAPAVPPPSSPAPLTPPPTPSLGDFSSPSGAPPVTAFTSYDPSPPVGAARAAPALALALSADLRSHPRATLLDRLAAVSLDALLVLIALALFDAVDEDGAYPVTLFLYTVGFWAWKGTTVGGIICSLRITRTNGESLRFVDALVRGLATLFSMAAAGIGMLWILRDPERQSWHDKIAGTYVVRVPRDWPLP
jgi:uncharacterized RDD family membrane protein YckC